MKLVSPVEIRTILLFELVSLKMPVTSCENQEYRVKVIRHSGKTVRLLKKTFSINKYWKLNSTWSNSSLSNLHYFHLVISKLEMSLSGLESVFVNADLPSCSYSFGFSLFETLSVVIPKKTLCTAYS